MMDPHSAHFASMLASFRGVGRDVGQAVRVDVLERAVTRADGTCNVGWYGQTHRADLQYTSVCPPIRARSKMPASRFRLSAAAKAARALVTPAPAKQMLPIHNQDQA